MSRAWMYIDRRPRDFIKGVHSFLNVAEATKRNGFMCCLGVKTEQIRMDSSETVFVTIFFSDSESERIVCGYEYGIRVYR
jgi:hypothetical protein